MKWSSVCLILFVQLLPLSLAHADDKSKHDKSKYEVAIAAIDAGDCKTALPLLEEFQSENKEKIKEHKDFEEQLRNQIARCTSRLHKRDQTNIDAYPPKNSKVQLNTF
jgi:hypothetical protein